MRYLLVLCFVALLALIAKNLVRGHIGRSWMAIRDMDIAAEIIGIRPLRTKLIAFAVSSFYVGIGGALWGFVHLAQVEPSAFDIDRSFRILSMIIIGGLGSLICSYFGAALIYIMPIILGWFANVSGLPIGAATVEHLRVMLTGVLIIFFLIVEPHGLARLWQIGKQKLRIWPFPY